MRPSAGTFFLIECATFSIRWPETPDAYGDVEIQGARGQVQGSVHRDHHGGSIVGIYLWENRAAANVFYTPDWVAMVTKRWAAPPQRQEWETPMVVESAERRLVAAE